MLSFGQDKLNQMDSVGKKDGKWVVYLDKQWKEVKDTAKAIYYRYTYYDHGTNLYPMGPMEKTLENAPQYNGKKILLNGEYKWLDKSGKAKFILVLKEGWFISYREFDKSGTLRSYFDYTKKWKGEVYTWRMTVYKKNGSVVNFFYRWDNFWVAWGENPSEGSSIDSTSVDIIKVIGDSSFVTSNYYRDGKLVRKRGEILVRLNYLHTKTIIHGIYTDWYLSGQKKWEGQYYYGQKQGIIISYYENGKKRNKEHIIKKEIK